jgi:hypothetical protein
VIEVAPVIGDRVIEVADLTGLPVITLRPFDDDLVRRYAWLADGGGRVLRLSPRAGTASLSPMNGAEQSDSSAEPVVGRASVPEQSEPKQDPPEEPEQDRAISEEDPPGEAVEEEPPENEEEPPEDTEEDEQGEPDVPVQVFAVPVTRTRISWRRFLRGEPDPARGHLLRRAWRCDAFECPAFGESRRIGQPVPRLRADAPICPRHDQPVRDVGPRPAAYPISIVVDDLPRRRLVVRSGQPVTVGRDTDDEDVVSVAAWLHQAATDWISPVHLRLEACDDGLVAFDLSDNGTVVWQRKGPDDPGTARPLHRDSYTLGEWDSVELYTGIELMRGDRRRAAVLGRDELSSVLVDAPTAAHHELTHLAG